jgi:hypothetical protein
MSRCLEPKSDADVHSLLCGDDLNPAHCRLRPDELGRFDGLSDRSSLLFFHLSPRVCTRGGGRRALHLVLCPPYIFMGLSDQQLLLTGYWRAHDMLKLLTSLLTKLRSGEIHTTILDPDFCISLAKDRFLYAKVVDSPMRIDNFSMN